jgi:hypothetical protein
LDFRLAELEENHMARKNSKQPASHQLQAPPYQAVARNEKLPTLFSVSIKSMYSSEK